MTAKRIARLFLGMLLLSLLGSAAAWAAGRGYHANGQLKYEYLYQDGQVREAKWYDEQGRLTSRAVYAGGEQTLAEGYRADGSLDWQSKTLEDGRREVTRFDAGGQPQIRYQMLGDQPDGTYTTFYPDGTPRQVVTYRQGRLEGPARTFFESGQVEHEFSYAEGLVEGPYRTYSADGQLLSEYTFDAGQLQ